MPNPSRAEATCSAWLRGRLAAAARLSRPRSTDPCASAAAVQAACIAAAPTANATPRPRLDALEMALRLFVAFSLAPQDPLARRCRRALRVGFCRRRPRPFVDLAWRIASPPSSTLSGVRCSTFSDERRGESEICDPASGLASVQISTTADHRRRRRARLRCGRGLRAGTRPAVVMDGLGWPTWARSQRVICLVSAGTS